jgi:hypothetical protein
MNEIHSCPSKTMPIQQQPETASYTPPELRKLGNMASVTLKSGTVAETKNTPRR